MSTMNAVPFPSPVATPLLGLWSDIAGLYRGAVQANTEQLVLSSVGIIQEQMLRAFITASQSCADALAKNALSVQQKSMERFAEANGKAVGLMGRAVTQAWMGGALPKALAT